MSTESESGEAPKLDRSATITRNENIVFTDLDDTIVMMDVDEGQYYELDPIAAKIWELIEDGATVGEICDGLTEQYEVDGKQCQEDTLEFLQSAVERRIVLVA